MKRVLKSVASTPNNKQSNIVSSVRSLIVSQQLFSYGDHVVVGLSGGPDSMALLHVLLSLRHELGVKISAAHFNHRIRLTANRDENFVKEYSKKLQIKIVCGRADHQPPSKGSLEDWARKERYKFFKQTLKSLNADTIALGHTADDLAETVLMRILRGSGLQGLIGMEPKRTIENIVISRPFLRVDKNQVMNYLKSGNIPYCLDETNLQIDFMRNKIRLELMPYLAKEYNLHIKQTLINLSHTASVDYSFVGQEARKIWDSDVHVESNQVRMGIQKVLLWHPSIRRMIIRMAYEAVKGDLNQLTLDHVLSVEQMIIGHLEKVELPAYISVKKDRYSIYFFQTK